MSEKLETVAVIGDVFQIDWIGRGPIAPIVKKHGLKVGDKLCALHEAESLLAERDAEIEQLRIKHQVACDTISRMQQERQQRHQNCVSSDQYVAAITEDANEFEAHHAEMLDIIAAKDATIAQQSEQLAALKLALDNSENRHVFEAPEGMCFMPENTPEQLAAARKDADRFRAYLRLYDDEGMTAAEWKGPAGIIEYLDSNIAAQEVKS